MSEKTIGFRTSREHADKLEALADELGISVSDLIRRALTHGITPAIQEIAVETKEGAKRALKMVRNGKNEEHTSVALCNASNLVLA